MSSIQGVREVAYIDVEGGGQVYLDGTTAYVGHMAGPTGTSVIDVADPKNARVIAELTIPEDIHSHKVRVVDGLMVVNREQLSQNAGAGATAGGIGIFDVSDPADPKSICEWQTAGRGVHRFDFDGRYAYISPTAEGYLGRIMMILDLKDPEHPQEVGRWWAPGQWEAGGETLVKPDMPIPLCHHPLRMGDRLYTSYWQEGFFILDISDMQKPRQVSGLDWHPPFMHPTHTALPIPFPVQGRDLLIVADEDVAPLAPSQPAFMWIVDITDETRPWPIASFQVEGFAGKDAPNQTGCHQPSEKVTGTEIPFAWFGQGLRVIDIADPHIPTEVAHFLPDPPPGESRVTSNDVTTDDRGLIYLLDRLRGIHVLERVG